MTEKHKRGEAIKQRIFGGSIGRTAIQLVIASIFVGAIFSFIGLGAFEFWEGIFRWVRDIIATIGDSLGEILINVLTYFLIGAAIVIPIWLIARILTSRR